MTDQLWKRAGFDLDPQGLDGLEFALVISVVPHFADLVKSRGLDPEKVKLTFTFSDSGRHISFTHREIS